MTRASSLLAIGIALGTAWPAAAGDVDFVEAGGCRILASDASARRMREIAARGTVTWEGRCVDGLIDGAGVLRHEGVETRAGRTQRFAFWLSGEAKAGRRTGLWRRESASRVGDSAHVRIGLADIRYVDGVAQGSARELPVRGPESFSEPFRALIARMAATAPDGPPIATVTTPAAAATPAPPANPRGTAPDGTAVISPSRADEARRVPAPAATAHHPAATGRERGLRQLAPMGTALPAPAPPALEGQRLLAQADGCILEQINGRNIGDDWIELPAREALRISGWAIDPARIAPGAAPVVPASAWLRVYQRGSAGVLVALARAAPQPDGVQPGRHGAERAGAFRVVVEAGRLPPGDYSVAIVQRLERDLAICTSLGRLRLY